MADHGIVCSMSRAGNVWDNAAMESFFSSMKIERTERKTYRTRGQAKADVFDYIERFYNPRRGVGAPVEDTSTASEGGRRLRRRLYGFRGTPHQRDKLLY